MKALLALVPPLMGAAMPTGNPASTQEGIDPAAKPEVVQVRCIGSLGSAFYVGPRTLVSVAHVTSNKGCFINDKPFTVDQPNDKADFTILHVADPVDKWLHVDCDGFIPGRKYTAWGFARGLESLTSVDILATGQFLWGFSRLWGVFNVIPGQSGGAITPDDEPDRVVGTVNVYDASIGNSGSVALKDTVLCQN